MTALVYDLGWSLSIDLWCCHEVIIIVIFSTRLSEANAKNREKDERLTNLDGVLKNLENKVPTRESLVAIKEKAAQVTMTEKLTLI